MDDRLADTDAFLARAYPGEDGRRQPVHTVYVPADRYDRGLPQRWGAEATALVTEHGGFDWLCAELGLADDLAAEVAPKVAAKLEREPIEDLRLDFEDGYGNRGDETEDADAVRVARELAAAVADGVAPAFVGLRFKCFEAPTRRRGLRTLDLFLATLLEAGPLPGRAGHHLPEGEHGQPGRGHGRRLRGVRDARPGCPPAGSASRSRSRLRSSSWVPTGERRSPPPCTRAPVGSPSLHYGTYDYSASLGVSAEYQSMAHPAADYAKEVMQAAVAGTGVHLSDGSTNILPVGAPDAGARGLAAAPPAGPAQPGARLLPGLGPASRAAADPVRRELRLLP